MRYSTQVKTHLALFLAATALAQDRGVMESVRRPSDFALTADPANPRWRGVPPVSAGQSRNGEPMPASRTEVRSLWTRRYLYFLFNAPYESMKLTPSPSTVKETWGLWDYDVVEVFIGWDPKNTGRYKEFEVSPQGEWVDLDVDRGRPGRHVDWQWDSRFEVRTRVDGARKIWNCEMRIPWKAIDPRKPAPGNELRLNLYRIEGSEPNRKYIAWRPVHSPSFHTPEAFGILRLVGR